MTIAHPQTAQGLRVVRHLEERDWRAFVEDNPRGNLFHTPEMFQVFARAKGHRPTLWATVGDEGRVLALLTPVEVTVLPGPLQFLTTRAVVYGSVLCVAGAEGRDALSVLLRAYNREARGRLLFTELRHQSDLTDLRLDLAREGFQHEEHLNYLIDLTPPESEIWRRVRSNAQRAVRRAQKSGVVVEEVGDSAGVAAAYRVWEQVYRRIHVPLADESLFQAAFEVLRPRGMLRILVARVDGEVAGAVALPAYKGIAYYWYAGVLREYSSQHPGDLLVWHSLVLSQQSGARTFDFVGAGRPDQEYGVREFKAKFGGDLVNYGRSVCVHSAAKLKLSQMGYQLVRKYL